MEQATYDDIKEAYEELSNIGDTHYIFYRGITEIMNYLKDSDLTTTSEFVENCLDRIEYENERLLEEEKEADEEWQTQRKHERLESIGLF